MVFFGALTSRLLERFFSPSVFLFFHRWRQCPSQKIHVYLGKKMYGPFFFLVGKASGAKAVWSSQGGKPRVPVFPKQRRVSAERVEEAN